MRLKNFQEATKMCTLKQLEFTSKWRKRKNVLLSRKLIRRAEGTLICKIYLKGFTMTDKEGSNIWCLEKNKKLVLKFSIAHSLHRQLHLRIPPLTRLATILKIKFMLSSTLIMTPCKGRSSSNSMKEKRHLRKLILSNLI